MALIHHQFEHSPSTTATVAPGASLNVLYLVRKVCSTCPVFTYLATSYVPKADYYRLLQSVRDADAWEDWVLYMLEAVEQTAGQTIRTIHTIKEALFDYKHRIP